MDEQTDKLIIEEDKLIQELALCFAAMARHICSAEEGAIYLQKNKPDL